jgi:hypothetical protein
MQNLKRCLNAKLPGSKRKKLNTDSQWLNSEEGLAKCERQEAEEREIAAQKQARAEARQAQQAEQQWQREERHPDEPFVGSLNSQRKVGLQDIAYSLGLDIEATVEDLKLGINAFFDKHEERRTDPRYIRLFPHLARQTHQATAMDTSAPSNSHTNNVNPQPKPLNNQYTQYNHFTSLAHNTQSNLAQEHLYHHNFNSSSHPGYTVPIPSYYNVNTHPPS